MDRYCTVQDVRNALTPGGTPDQDTTAASLPDWQILDQIDEAMTIVDSYLSKRYTVIVTDTEISKGDPPSVETVKIAVRPIRWWTRSIAAYLSALVFRKNKDLPEDDPIRLRYQMALGFLQAVRDDTLDLPADAATPIGGATTSDVAAYNLYEGTMFTFEDVGLTNSGGDSVQRYVPEYRPWL